MENNKLEEKFEQRLKDFKYLSEMLYDSMALKQYFYSGDQHYWYMGFLDTLKTKINTLIDYLEKDLSMLKEDLKNE